MRAKMGDHLKRVCGNCGRPILALAYRLRSHDRLLFCDDACEQGRADDEILHVLTWLVGADEPAVA
jgi:hypothetical protein